MVKIKTYKLIIFLLCICGFFSCSPKKNTALRRCYHNMNARYNVYFNGNESLKKGVTAINKSFKDNYNQVLPIFTFDETSVSVATSDMDKTIQKSSKLIKKHSITAKPKKDKANLSKKDKDFYQKHEFCKWVDDAYLLMGKAHFYKRDFISAQNTLEYIPQNYPDENTPSEAKLWIARTHLEAGDYKNASEVLDLFKAKEYPDKLKRFMYLLYADYFIKQQKYEDAIPHIKKALNYVKDKATKARLTYILAQIEAQKGNRKKASELYQQVIKMNPPYEMAFSAKISRATLVESGDKSADIKKQLRKMLKDEKNDEFQDQIYYALANVYLKEKDVKQAKEYYRLSSAKSKTNKNQKAISCLALADLYFGEMKYELAQAYYDTTITNLNKNYPNYNSLYTKTKNLNDLIKNLKIIQNEDSLQRIAKMPKNEQEAFINSIIEKVKAEEEEKKNALKNNNNQILDPNSMDEETSSQNASFPFYSQSLIAKGIVVFKQKWGDRTLEDNWRRKNKAVNAINNTEIKNTKTDSKKTEKVLTNKMPEYYLVNLPLTDSALAVSNAKIERAMYESGDIYNTKIQDSKEAIKQYEEFANRFPNSKLLLDVYYSLYMIYIELKDTKKAEYYKNEIIRTFPNSSYAKAFVNPNYAKELMASKKVVEDEYQRIYALYLNKQYQDVLTACNEAKNKFPDNFMIHKFKFIEALSIGNLEKPDITHFKDSLLAIIKKYPDTDVKSASEEIIAQMDKSTKVVDKTVSSIYKLENQTTHLYVISTTNLSIDFNKVIFQLNKFCALNFNNLNVTIAKSDLKKEVKLFTIKSFASKKEADAFFKQISTSNDVFQNFKSGEYEQFVISENNFAILQRDKDITKYVKFFKANY